ncbi:MAG TPA: phage holin family protein [Thermoanaerobaculia bacterium]|nr:phage holin family protein [Thermoanaerobaculia bacterium]
MSNYTATDSERTLGTIIKDLAADISTLVRSEIALLKLELKDSVAKLGTGGAMMAAALFLALVGLAFLFVTITLGMIALGLPPWLSSLIVTVVLFVAAGVLVMMGKKKLQDVNFVPTDSIDHIKGDIDAIKADVARVRSR